MEEPQNRRAFPPLTMPTALPWPPETAPATWPSTVSSRVMAASAAATAYFRRRSPVMAQAVKRA